MQRTTVLSYGLVFLLTLSHRAGATQLLVPAYWGAYGKNTCTSAGIKGKWATAVAAGGSNLTLIINPNSGPDYSGDDATVHCLPHLKAKGATLIGYVPTGYGSRAIADVQKDIAQYKKAYAGISGIFLDEGSSWWDTTAAKLVTYTNIAKYIRAQNFSSITINSGTRFPPQFLTLFNTVVGYESAASSWQDANSHGICPTPSFATGGDPGLCSRAKNCDVNHKNCRSRGTTTVGAIVFCAPAGNMTTLLRQATAAGYGAVYVTNDGCKDTNPYDSLPSYWADERTAVVPGA